MIPESPFWVPLHANGKRMVLDGDCLDQSVRCTRFDLESGRHRGESLRMKRIHTNSLLPNDGMQFAAGYNVHFMRFVGILRFDIGLFVLAMIHVPFDLPDTRMELAARCDNKFLDPATDTEEWNL